MGNVLRDLRGATAAPDGAAYVTFSGVPYRGHALLRDAVLAVTRPEGSVLDAGCSSGYLSRVLVQAGRVVDGVELDPVAADEARAVCRRVVVGDLSALGADDLGGPYDTLLFGDTLEHLADPAATLQRLVRDVLAPRGHVVVSLPNVANWTIRAQLLLGRFAYRERGILDRTHLRFFTRRSAVELLQGAGLEVLDVKAAVPVPGITGVRLGRITHRAGNLLPGLLAYTFVITARRR
jgi:2-polyprenyl-3-methyl-5-hydroxy-6-metoxy-1,4-benzoquinol methylase